MPSFNSQHLGFICVGCAGTFPPGAPVARRDGKTVCSPRCYMRVKRSENQTASNATCRQCGNPLTAMRSDAKYCNSNCRVVWHRVKPEAQRQSEKLAVRMATVWQKRTAGLRSNMFNYTTTLHITPSGIRIPRETATPKRGLDTASWPTTVARDYKGSGSWARKGKSLDLPKAADLAGQGGGQLNPALPRWLMGLPVEWCQAAIRAHRTVKKQKPPP